MTTKMIQDIVSDKLMILNTSTFLISLSQVDMIIKMIFYIVSIFYTIFMLYKKYQEIKDHKQDRGAKL